MGWGGGEKVIEVVFAVLEIFTNEVYFCPKGFEMTGGKNE